VVSCGIVAVMRICVVGGLRGVTPASCLAEAFIDAGHSVTTVPEERLAGPMSNFVDWMTGRDLLVWSRSHGGMPDARQAMLDTANDLGVRTVAWHPDLFWGVEREHQIADDPFFRCDTVITTDDGHTNLWADAGVNHMWHPPVTRYSDTTHDVVSDPDVAGKAVFVGSWERYPHASWPWRMRMINELRRRFGHRFVCYPLSNRRTRGAIVSGAQLAAIIQSASCVVGDTCHAGMVHGYWSDRVPITLGMGGVLVHPEIPGMNHHFTDEHLVTVPPQDMEAMISTVQSLLGTDHQGMRAVARERVREDHTYRNLATTITGLYDGP